MKRQTNWNRTWQGWHWQFIGMTVVGLGILQAAADLWFRYPLTTSMPLVMLLTIYLVVPRTKEKRILNTMAAVVVMFLVNILLQAVLPLHVQKVSFAALAEMDAAVLVMGLVMAFFFVRLSIWSDRKRVEAEEKRRHAAAAKDPGKPTQRVRRHRWKKKPKKRR